MNARDEPAELKRKKQNTTGGESMASFSLYYVSEKHTLATHTHE